MAKTYLYRESLALLTDLYQLTMAYGYWKNGMESKEAVFHLFFRKPPFHGGFAISAGLEYVIDFIQSFQYSESDLEYLSTLTGADDKPYFVNGFLDYLSSLRFHCDIDAIPEGAVVFPQEPLLRVSGSIIQCQLLESPILNLVNFSTLIATKAARVCHAARGDQVLEFGMRRAQGVDGAITASRSSYIGGCHATSNVLAGKLFGIPVKGTHAHSWVMAFEDELQSFQAFAQALPGNCVFLVDTYDTLEGVKKAIEVGKWLKEKGKKMLGVRLDSGDLTYLSIVTRNMLDEAGFSDAHIFASNELDEGLISELKRQGAKIGVWGVGTNLVTGKEQPALDGVYKLSAIRDPGSAWEYKLKLSEQLRKVNTPGILQVRRFRHEEGYIADAIYDIHNIPSDYFHIIDPFDATRTKSISQNSAYEDLLVPIFQKGKLVYQLPSIEQIRENTYRNLSHFHEGVKRFLNPHQYPVGLEKRLYDIKTKLIKKIRDR